MTKVIVEVRNLTKIYGDRAVVDGINFSVNEKEIFGILGPNGAGKTTTLEMIEAMRPIDKGSIMLDEIDVAKHPRDVKSIIGVQPQSPSFSDRVTLIELLELFGALYGVKVHPHALLKDVQLGEKDKSYFENLSGGQKQRFSIAAALVHNPKVLFLDEPTTGLDPQARRNLWELVESIREKGITVIMTTHYMEEAQLLCDRVAIMDKGKIIALDTPSSLVSQLLKKGFKKKRVVEEADLEDVFIDLTGKALRD